MQTPLPAGCRTQYRKSHRSHCGERLCRWSIPEPGESWVYKTPYGHGTAYGQTARRMPISPWLGAGDRQSQGNRYWNRRDFWCNQCGGEHARRKTLESESVACQANTSLALLQWGRGQAVRTKTQDWMPPFREAAQEKQHRGYHVPVQLPHTQRKDTIQRFA